MHTTTDTERQNREPSEAALGRRSRCETEWTQDGAKARNGGMGPNVPVVQRMGDTQCWAIPGPAIGHRLRVLEMIHFACVSYCEPLQRISIVN